MNISGFGGFQPTEIQQKMQDRFSALDTDQSGSLTLEEVKASSETTGADASKIENMFSRFDANGDGEVTAQEQQQGLEAFQERLEQFQSGVLSSHGFGEQANNLESLLQSLNEDSDDEEQKQKLENLQQRFEQEGANGKLIADSVSEINGILPPIDTTV